ncbi:MAG: PspA/IM30 family protein [Candidatus Competibacteraceae bacterium]|nr:PspA/IM30 family protein [Candidatus Competibacteraceae bacterium]MBK7983478.1 PspA/IM30 family protein [Candidatus Competibacteraceae bacterium]MBK8897981.1 PspA/IM30 family protein [Candidatus Competibacteraceae bacterium]MBK8961785.1 PspA/IM30 family protein [Candidatus Competibacteraceae bacterium]MBK9951001.1 PspA/IM30 family protein [Candidatus Competibacteraceae bacterium]
MANLFKRISDVISANLNDLVDRVEDPERMIKQLIREMEENINSAREGVIDAVASEKQLAKELENQRRQAEEWHGRARRALESGNEALAREALLRKKEHDAVVANLETSWESAKRTSERLKTQLRALEMKLEEARLKKGSLVARQRAAQARGQMDQVYDRFQTGLDLNNSLGRMAGKVDEMEARMEAREELYGQYSQIEREFLKMEVNSEVEAELAALKQEALLGKH